MDLQKTKNQATKKGSDTYVINLYTNQTNVLNISDHGQMVRNGF